jgi:hypothetical protein
MGQILAGVTVASALAAGFGVYYTTVYAFYDRVEPQGAEDVMLTRADSGAVEPIAHGGFEAIDSDSSPIRYRACFTTPEPLKELTATYAPYDGAEPRNAPGWFECFDAEALGLAIEEGQARVFTGARNIEWGIDRVVAITEDGRGYVWHEINDCGDKAYDGTPLGEDCPPRP